MDMRLFSIMLAFGAVALLSGAAPSLAAPSQAEYTRDKCIKIAIGLFAQIPIGDDVMARLKEARHYYYTDVNPEYTPIPLSGSCHLLAVRVSAVDASIPAPCEQVMGTDKYQNLLDILKRSKAARSRVEAAMACIYDHKAGNTMRTLGVFYAITGSKQTQLV